MPGWQEVKKQRFELLQDFPGHFLPWHTSFHWLRKGTLAAVTGTTSLSALCSIIQQLLDAPGWSMARGGWVQRRAGSGWLADTREAHRCAAAAEDAKASRYWAKNISFPGTRIISCGRSPAASPSSGQAKACCDLRKRPQLLSMLGFPRTRLGPFNPERCLLFLI